MPRLYFAGFEHGHSPYFRRLVDGLDIRDVLVTFAHSGKFPLQKQRDFFSWAKEKKFSVLVDSGVFTFYGRAQLTRAELLAHYEAYAAYLLRYRGLYEFAVNLDVDKLAGYGPEWSDDFYSRLSRHGLPILPVWHFTGGRECYARLEKLALSHERVAIGVNALRTARSTKNDDKFHERLGYIYSRYPDNKFHLLGLTDPVVLAQYPVYSGDSSTWIQKAKYGDIVFWNEPRSKVQYTHRARVTKLSDIVAKLSGHNFQLDRAMNLCGSGTESMLERGCLALQAFIFMRDFTNKLWEKKNGKETNTVTEGSPEKEKGQGISS